MNKIIFIVSAPFNKRDYDRYGMELFINNGFDIFVWDLSDIFYREMKSAPVFSWDKHVVFSSMQDVLAALNGLPDTTFIITTVAYDSSTFALYRAISRKKIPYIINSVSVLPPFNRYSSMKDKLYRLFKIFNLKKLHSYFIRKIPIKYFHISPANFVLAEGLKCNIVRQEVAKTTQIIRTHSLDYDIYLKNQPAVMENGSIIFIDDNLAFHPDFAAANDQSPVTPEVYYPELCRFFDFIEQKYHLKVIIAAHPRSNYDQMTDLFGGRQIIKNKTAELVRESSAVILNCSTAITFAVLYKKPIIFFTTDELNSGKYNRDNYQAFIESFAVYFGKKPINISQEVNDHLTIDFETREADYSAYRNDYIKVDGSEDLPFWQIVCNQIKHYSLRKRDDRG